ncbi:hypothetical protein [Anoxynatronum sibiricum]|uniref:Uncharacterized protein n=1 Tax=Anoxynatronum sibiricum TaxID=210623 RepID=A0ABU9VWC9_9CLOT
MSNARLKRLEKVLQADPTMTPVVIIRPGEPIPEWARVVIIDDIPEVADDE